MAFAQYKWFEEWKDEKVQKRGVDYESLKNAIVESILKTVFKLYPRIEDKVRKPFFITQSNAGHRRSVVENVA